MYVVFHKLESFKIHKLLKFFTIQNKTNQTTPYHVYLCTSFQRNNKYIPQPIG